MPSFLSSAHRPGRLSILVYIFLYLLPLGARPLFIPDETRYAEIPREMIAGGDWIVPHINGVRYFEKPVLGYWVSAVSLLVVGENNFGVRLPSALATGFTALLLLLLGDRRGKSDPPPLRFAPFVLLTALGVVGVGTFAVLDSLFSFFLTATLISFFLATEEKAGSGRERLRLGVAGLAAGCAFLTKGFLAFAVPTLTAAPYLALTRRWRDCFRMLPLPLAAALVLALPWSLLIHGREPDFWNYFFFHEHLHRFLSDSAQHREPFWYFSAVLPPMLLPWTFMVPAVLPGLLRYRAAPQSPEKRLMLYSLCWLFFPFFFFSASNGKLLTYILPCFPATAILLSLGLSASLWDGGKTRLFNTGLRALLFFFVLLIAGLLLVQVAAVGPFRPFIRSWKWLLLINGLIVAVLICIAALRCRDIHHGIVLCGLAPAALLFITNFTLPKPTLDVKAPGLLLSRHKTALARAGTILSGEETARSVPWYAKRDDILLIERGGELDYGLRYADEAGRLLSPQAAGQLISRQQGRVVLIAEYEEYDRWRHHLPLPTTVDSMGKFLFLSYH